MLEIIMGIAIFLLLALFPYVHRSGYNEGWEDGFSFQGDLDKWPATSRHFQGELADIPPAATPNLKEVMRKYGDEKSLD